MLSRFKDKAVAKVNSTASRPRDAAQNAAQQVLQHAHNPGQQQQQQQPPAAPGSTPSHLPIHLHNDTNSREVYAYVTGQALDQRNALFLLRADGHTPYFPSSPPEILQPLKESCAIPLGGPGSTLTVHIPRLAGGRIWFSTGRPLTFLLNPGPALVEPSVTNPSDPNFHADWGFCEFTFNHDQLFANISYVDFVSLPIALHLHTQSGGGGGSSGNAHRVRGMPADGLQRVVAALHEQEKRDGRAWTKLVVHHKDSNSAPLRVLSPNAGRVVAGEDIFRDYYKEYVDAAWAKYAREDLRIDTQAQWGVVTGRAVKGGSTLRFSDGSEFAKPTAADIFSCSTGPFAGGSPSKLAIVPRLAAALNRSTLLCCADQPRAVGDDAYYNEDVTNHYARVVHDINAEGRGYAFPYDDVVGRDGFDSAGTVFDGRPTGLTVSVGGKSMGC